MKRNLRQLLAILLAMVLVIGIMPVALAQEGDYLEHDATDYAIAALGSGDYIDISGWWCHNFVAALRDHDPNLFNGGLLVRELVEQVLWLELSSRNISSLAGIGHFISLQELDVSNNQLFGLDLSQNPALERIDVSNNQLTWLDLSQNPALEQINVSNNSLHALLLPQPQIPALKSLNASNNLLRGLYIPQSPALEWLDVSNNQLQTNQLYIPQSPALEWLDVSNNWLSGLDVSQNPALKSLNASRNQLHSFWFDLSQNPELEWLNVQGNNLQWLNVSQNHELRWLNVSNNWDLIYLHTQNPVLEELYASFGSLTSLDVSQSPYLSRLIVHNNYLTSLDISQNPYLRWLNVSMNYMQSPDDVIGWQNIGSPCLGDPFIFWEQRVPQQIGNTPCAATNLAHNSQGTLMSASSSQGVRTADRANNGITTGAVNSWEAASAGQEWLMADFGEQRNFNHIRIFQGGNRIADYRFEYSNDGVNWTTIRTGSRIMEQNPAYYEFRHPTTIQARYVRLFSERSFGVLPIVVFEFEVYYMP